MTRHDKLYEAYEDALFALLMEDVAEAEGNAALAENERLKTDPSAAMPEQLRRKCMTAIRRGFAKQSFQTVGRTTARVASKVAILVAVLTLSFVVAFASSPQVRGASIQWAVRTYSNHLMIIRDNDASETDDVNHEQKIEFETIEIALGWMPSDMVLVDSGRNAPTAWLVYQNGGRQFAVLVKSSGGVSERVVIDTENAELSFVNIQGESALMSASDNYCEIYFPIGSFGGYVIIDSEGISPEDVLKIAQSLSIGQK